MKKSQFALYKEQAMIRVANTPELQGFWGVFFGDWSGADCLYWVATAPLKEILDWLVEEDESEEPQTDSPHLYYLGEYEPM